MHYVKLGNTGLDVSALALGGMAFGDPTMGRYRWAIGEEASRPLIQAALEAGINFIDTANVYAEGTSEEIIGRALRDFTTREAVVIATKVNGRMRPGPNGSGLSRAAIMREIDNSLARLGTDYIDLYQIHRWDPTTPVEETMEALHDVVKAGKARYIGASSMWTWQFAKAQHVAQSHGWTRFVSMQPQYNLLYREDEREMLPFCADQGIAVVPWSPLARGRLSRSWGDTTFRNEHDDRMKVLYDDGDKAIVDRVSELSTQLGVRQAQLALAWVRRNPVVTAPIIGVTKPQHLADALAALTITLTDEQASFLEEPYRPHQVTAF